MVCFTSKVIHFSPLLPWISYSSISHGFHILIQNVPRSFIPSLRIYQPSSSVYIIWYSSSQQDNNIGCYAFADVGRWVGLSTPGLEEHHEPQQRPALQL